MLKFQTRKRVATHVAVDVTATALAWLLAYALRFHADPVGWLLPVTKGVPDLSRYLLLLPLMAVALAGGPVLPRALPAQARAQPHRRALRDPLQRAHRLRPDPGRHPLRPRLLPLPARGRAALGVQPGGVRDLRRPRRPAPERRALGGPRVGGAPVGGRRQPHARPGGGDRRARPHRRRDPPRPPRARLPGGGLPRRATRRRGPRRASRRGHDRRGPRRHRAQPGRPALRRPAPRGPRPPRPPRQGPEQRVRRHQGGPRRRAVRDHQGRARGPRRDPDHQPQRGAAPGLEQHGEAADGRGGVLAPPAGPHPRSRPARCSPCSFASSAAGARSCFARSA